MNEGLYIPLDVIVTEVSQNKRLNHFGNKSRQEPQVPTSEHVQIPPSCLINLHAIMETFYVNTYITMLVCYNFYACFLGKFMNSDMCDQPE